MRMGGLLACLDSELAVNRPAVFSEPVSASSNTFHAIHAESANSLLTLPRNIQLLHRGDARVQYRL